MYAGARKTGTIIDNGEFHSPDLIVTNDPWAPIQLYSVYRLVLSGILLLLGLTGTSSVKIGQFDPHIFSLAANAYVGVAVLGVLLAHFKKPNATSQIYLNSITDIGFLLLVVYTSGGLNSGLGILILLPVIFTSTLRPGQGSLSLLPSL